MPPLPSCLHRGCQLVGAFLETDLLEFMSEYELPLAKSPTGTLTITPDSVVAGTATQLDEKATFTVNRDVQTVSYLGIESVESVEIRWLEDDGSGNKMLTFGRPGCTSMAAAAGQAQFT